MPTMIRELPPIKSLGLLIVVAGASSYFFVWLWREWLLAAVAFSVLLLFGGGLLPSNKNQTIQSIALGFAIGAFIGGAIGIARLINTQ
jgi:ABC-type nitrate/sulfonate/bicarbonate transport system permease component